MTPSTFTRWLADMKSTGLARSDAHCARLLGLSANSIVNIKRSGTDQRTALACSALLHNLKPYPQECSLASAVKRERERCAEIADREAMDMQNSEDAAWAANIIALDIMGGMTVEQIAAKQADKREG